MKNPTPKNVLIEVRRLIAHQENWHKGSDAKNAEGEVVCFDDKRACSFCLHGASYRAWFNLTGERLYNNDTDSERSPIYKQAVLTIREHLPKNLYSYIHFNDRDDTKHKEVLAVLDMAIAAMPSTELLLGVLKSLIPSTPEGERG